MGEWLVHLLWEQENVSSSLAYSTTIGVGSSPTYPTHIAVV